MIVDIVEALLIAAAIAILTDTSAGRFRSSRTVGAAYAVATGDLRYCSPGARRSSFSWDES